MPHRQRFGTGTGAFDFGWPAISACAILLGFVIAVSFDSAPAIGKAVTQVHRILAWRGWSAEPEARQALVITANRRDQLIVVATLSPRGFAPLLAGSGREALSQIRTHPGTLSLAVVDAALPDYALVARALKGILPTGGIIVLNGPHGSQDVGPMLLDRLGVFETLDPPGTNGSVRASKPAASPLF